MKRCFDILLSFIGLVVLSPIIIMIILLIKIDDGGEIFITQLRAGKFNRKFKIYKFRTMVKDAPIVATHLLENEELYTTRVGSFLRKTSLDELPQLLNILKGDMSIIGPRPLLLSEVEVLEERGLRGIANLKPGLTGWAQIKARDEKIISKKIYLEEYLRNKSFLLDIKIVFMTIYKVISRAFE
ncbi:MAG: sugar transferase [Sarcina sp.]